MNVLEFIERISWQLIALVAIFAFRKPITAWMDRVKDFRLKAGPVDLSTVGAAKVEKLAAELARTTPDLGPLQELVESVPQRVTEAGGSEPLLSELVKRKIEVAEREAQQKRRAEIEMLITESVQQGWSLAKAGFQLQPWPRVEWDAAGKPHIAYSSSARPE